MASNIPGNVPDNAVSINVVNCYSLIIKKKSLIHLLFALNEPHAHVNISRNLIVHG